MKESKDCQLFANMNEVNPSMDIDNKIFYSPIVVYSQQNIPLASVKFPLRGGGLDYRRGIWGSNQGTQEGKSNLSRETCPGKQSRSELHFTSGMWSQATLLDHNFSTRKSIQSFRIENPFSC
jgi:hypothetical protein